MGTAKKMSVGQRILQGLAELETALDHKVPLAKRFTVRTVELDLEPHEHTKEDFKRIRLLTDASQAVFAELLGISVDAVRAYEQGKRVVPKVVRRLLDEIQDDPARWKAKLKAATRRELVTKD